MVKIKEEYYNDMIFREIKKRLDSIEMRLTIIEEIYKVRRI